MSTISEQAKQLRLIAEEYRKPPYGREVIGTAEALCRAADTIEALSAKLAKENMERSERYYNGGWILCSDRLPKEDNDVLIYTPYDGIDIAYISDGCWRYTRGDEFMGMVENLKIIAWQPLPEPYKPQ